MTALRWIYLILGFIILAYANKEKSASGCLLALICFVWSLFLHFA